MLSGEMQNKMQALHREFDECLGEFDADKALDKTLAQLSDTFMRKKLQSSSLELHQEQVAQLVGIFKIAALKGPLEYPLLYQVMQVVFTCNNGSCAHSMMMNCGFSTPEALRFYRDGFKLDSLLHHFASLYV